MKKNEKATVLFSGGVDSSLVAAKAAAVCEEIYLVTCMTQCMVASRNIDARCRVLMEKYPETRFTHVTLSSRRILKKLWDGFALGDLRVAGLYRSYPCAPCKLSIHLRGLVFCLENGISQIYDGSNVMMSFNPCQNPGGIELLREFYARYGIAYETPVYWYENVDIMLLSRYPEFRNNRAIQGRILRGKSTAEEALEIGVVSGDMKLDVRNQYATQPLCTQAVYATYFLQYLFFPLLGFSRLERTMLRRLRRQLALMKKRVDRHLQTGREPMFLDDWKA